MRFEHHSHSTWQMCTFLSRTSVRSIATYARKRNNYVTPKSYLELIDFYKKLLGEKRNEVRHLIDRLDTGLATLAKTEKDVTELQVDLNHTLEKVEEKKLATDKLLADMSVQTEDAEEKKKIAAVERKRPQRLLLRQR